MEKLKVSKDNNQSRMHFVNYWANYIRSTPDWKWGEQQNLLINSMMHSGKFYPFSAKQYLKLKGEKYSELRT